MTISATTTAVQPVASSRPEKAWKVCPACSRPDSKIKPEACVRCDGKQGRYEVVMR